MDMENIPFKQCSRKEECINPLGNMLPATREYFHLCSRNKDGLDCQCKECRNNLSPERREKIRQRARDWAMKHPERVRDNKRAYYQSNRDRLLKYAKARYALKSDQIRAYTRVWKRKYCQTEHGKMLARINSHKRRAMIRRVGGIYTEADVTLQFRSQKGKCWHCGAILKEFHVDHLIPLIRGGSNDASNIVLACPTCNLKKQSKLTSEWNGKLF